MKNVLLGAVALVFLTSAPSHAKASCFAGGGMMQNCNHSYDSHAKKKRTARHYKQRIRVTFHTGSYGTYIVGRGVNTRGVRRASMAAICQGRVYLIASPHRYRGCRIIR